MAKATVTKPITVAGVAAIEPAAVPPVAASTTEPATPVAPSPEQETALVAAEVVEEPAPEIDLGPNVTMVLLTSMGGARAYVPGEDYGCSAAEGGRMRAAGIAKPKGDADAAAIDAYVAAILAGGEQA